MIAYTVKKGDTLSQIAYRYQTTTAIIMGDNKSIKDPNVIAVGLKINIRTSEEYAKAKAASAKKSTAAATAQKASSSPATAVLTKDATGAVWNGMTINSGQTGIVTATRKTNLYTIDSKGNLKISRTTEKNSRYRAYGSTTAHSGMYILGGLYIRKADAVFEAIPKNLDVKNTKPGTATVVHNGATSNKTQVKGASSDPILPQFQMPGYRRTRMQVKRADGKTLTMEMRITAFMTGYSNQYTPTRTNEGWMVNVGGKNLTSISINGFLLDTLTNREADDFLTNYNNHFSPKNSGNFYSSAVTTILHKNREFRGLIESISISDQAETPLDRKFSMRFLVLSEKVMRSTDANATAFAVKRYEQNEIDFMSSIKNMLTNPITGKFNTHN